LEITESTLADHGEKTLRTLDRLYKLGLHLSIDDFGTGYSSLSSLQHFPIGTLKIDQSFLRDAGSEQSSAAIVGAIVGLGQSLGMDVVAEGIETMEQLALLRRLGCTLGQGHLFGEPVTGERYLELLLAQQQGKPAHAALLGRGLRRVPHRPAHRRRRAAGPLAARARPRDRRHRRVRGAGVLPPPSGTRVGIPWLGHACGACRYCRATRTSADAARFTGYQLDGGYAEYTVADARFCFPLPAEPRRGARGAAALRRPDRLPHAAMAGDGPHAIGDLRLRRRGAHRRAGARWQGREVYAFTRPGDARPRRSRASSAPRGPATRTSRRTSRWTPR
jgi:hypothetical protein